MYIELETTLCTRSSDISTIYSLVWLCLSLESAIKSKHLPGHVAMFLLYSLYEDPQGPILSHYKEK